MLHLVPQRRFFIRLANKARRLLKPVATSPAGFKIEITSWNLLQHLGDLDRIEAHNLKWLEFLTPGCVVYDIGSNVGMISLLAAYYLAGNCRIYAFETGIDNQSQALKNIRLNNFSHTIFPINAAITRQSGLAKLRFTSNIDGVEMGFYVEGYRRGPSVGDYISHVPAFCVDDLVHRYGLEPPEHLKIDVDGAEGEVLWGAMRTIEEHVRSINLEYAADLASVLDALTQLGRMGFEEVFHRKVDQEEVIEAVLVRR